MDKEKIAFENFPMTTLQKSTQAFNKGINDALVDQLRACISTREILDFEEWFNSKTKTGPLHELICDMLKNRSISRGLAAKWLSILLQDKFDKISK